MKNKIVYLLGAGAMIDFGGPKTSELTTFIKAELNECGYHGIVASLDELYDGKYNFETVISAIEELLNYTIAVETQGFISVDNTNVIRAIYECKHKGLKPEDLWVCFSRLINIVINEISKYDIIDSSALDECSIYYDYKLASLYQYLFNKSAESSLKIYSLNYDRLIPNLLSSKHFYDATNENHIADNVGSNFEYDFMKFINNDLTYFNLHGSIYLTQDKNEQYRVVQSTLSNDLKYALYQKGGSPNEHIIFSPIITGYNKSQRILSEPFNFGFSAFLADLNTCDELIIVGYSFSDPHINSVIGTNLKKISSMTIVDYKKDNDISDIELKLETELNLIHKFNLQSDKLYQNFDGNIRIHTGGFCDFLKDTL